MTSWPWLAVSSGCLLAAFAVSAAAADDGSSRHLRASPEALGAAISPHVGIPAASEAFEQFATTDKTDVDHDGVVIQKVNRSHSLKGTIVREMEATTNKRVAENGAEQKRRRKNSTVALDDSAENDGSKDVSPARASEVHEDKGNEVVTELTHDAVPTYHASTVGKATGVATEAANQASAKKNATKEEADLILDGAEPIFTPVTKNVGMKAGSGDNVTQEAKKPFIKVTKHTQDEGAEIRTSVKVEMVAPTDIMAVYMIMFIPLILAWTMYYSSDSNPGHLAMLLPLTLLVNTVGMDFANQSLSAVIAGPHVLTAMQAWALAFITGVWTIMFRRPQVAQSDSRALWYWMAAALAFTVTQLVSHMAYWRCSLYERTIFLNMCPVVSVLLEQHVMPKGFKPSVGFWNKTALSITVVGAALLGLEAPALSTVASVATSSLLVVCMVMCRLTQRFLLADAANGLPVPLLACIDGLMLGSTATLVAFSEIETYRPSLKIWLQEPSVQILLIISMLVFTAYHVTVLLILRFTSATNALVFANMGNILNVALGLEFFGDSRMNIFLTPVAFLGLAISLFSAVWFATEADHPGALQGFVSRVGAGYPEDARLQLPPGTKGSRREVAIEGASNEEGLDQAASPAPSFGRSAST